MTFLHKLAQRLATCCFAVGALALVLAGCEKEGQRDFLAPSFSTTSTTSSATSTYSGKLSINPRKGQVGVSGKLALVGWSYLTSGDSTKPRVTWSTSGGGSTISTQGVFRSTKKGNYKVRAVQSLASGAKLIDSVTVVVGAVAGEVITVDPVAPTLSKGASRLFEAKGHLPDGTVTTPVVNWRASGGAIDTSGVYTAGTSTGTYPLAATLNDGSLTGGTAVTVVAATLTQLVLNPSQVTLTTGGTVQFAVAGSWSDGSSAAPSVAWSATGGSVSADGLYTAGSTPGTFRVIASYGGLADTAAVAVSAPVSRTLTSLTVSPKVFSLSAGGTQQLTATALWSDGSTTLPTVTWNASGGTISSSGLYTAGSVAGNYWATVSAGGLSDAAVMTVTATTTTATVTQFTLSPGSATVAAGATQQFQTAATWSDGVSRLVSVAYSATGGTVSTGGLYTAGQVAGTFAVIATCSCGKTDTSAVVVSVPVSRTLTRLTVSPKTVSLAAGATQQFTATALWSDGSTTLPTLTWAASGGTITGGGLYTAGSVAGNYWATVSAGGLSDAAVMTISTTVSQPPSGSAVYPNRPTNYSTVLGEFDASASVPAGGQTQRVVVGTPWSVIYDGINGGTTGSNWTRVSDATAPQSPPYVWQLHFPPGTWDTGHGFGNLFTTLPPTNSELYLSLWIKWDPNYEWHPISNKFLWFDAGQILVQALEGGTYLHAEDLDIPTWFTPQTNTPITLGVWHHVEVQLVRGAAGMVKVWMDGGLKTSYTGTLISPANNAWADFVLTGHRGGGAFTNTRDSYYWVDHIFIAAP